MEKAVDLKSDGLEITSIGVLYSGPLDKKYWSSSRGRDRYPYPIGYQAVRITNRGKFRVEIQEGMKGPLFMIYSSDGRSCTGQTPDIACEILQKKGLIHMKILNEKRSMSKIDGVEFFGFKNPFLQRLFRELVANVNVATEQSLLTSSFCNDTFEVGCPDSMQTFKNSPLTQRRPKRLKHKKTKESLRVIMKKTPYSDMKVHNLDDSCKQEDEEKESQNKFPSPTFDRLEVDNMVGNTTSTSVKIKDESEKFSQDGVVLSLTGLCAPDTDVFSDSDPLNIDKIPCNVKEDSVTEEAVDHRVHDSEGATYANTIDSCSEKNDSSDQDFTKAMMSVLLPQALPLLKYSRKRKKAISSSISLIHVVNHDDTHNHSIPMNPSSSDGMPSKNLQADLNISETELMRTVIIPDSFENEKCETVVADSLPCFEPDQEVAPVLHNDLISSFENKTSDLRNKTIDLKNNTHCDIQMLENREIRTESLKNNDMDDGGAIHSSSHLTTHGITEFKNELSGTVDLVGCYVHPSPVTHVLLSTKEDKISICALCEHTSKTDMILFFYKVSIKGQQLGLPTFIGHMSASLQPSKFGKEVRIAATCFQFTPDAQYLVIGDKIRVPCCREQRIDCSCLECNSVCYEENTLRIIQIERGYASIVETVKINDGLVCFLVCGPDHLVVAGENGGLHLWVMDLTWRKKAEEFVFPTSLCINPYISELKKVPRCNSLIVGHNSYGEFGVWDVVKRVMVSRFSSSPNSYVSAFFPVCAFSLDMKKCGFVNSSTDEDDQIDSILNSFKNQTHSPSHSPLQSGDNIALCILLRSSSLYPQHATSLPPWRLGLLANNMLFLGSPFDPRAAVMGSAEGRGVIGTSDGRVYLWDIVTGAVHGALHCFRGGEASCMAVDAESWPHPLAVAGDGGRLLIYIHSREGSTEGQPLENGRATSEAT